MSDDLPMLKCGYCYFAPPFAKRAAEFIVDGQAVCEEHVDTAAAGNPFGRGLTLLSRAYGEEQG